MRVKAGEYAPAWHPEQPPVARPPRIERLHQRLFDAIYSRSLVYTACWEDPAVDRQILELGADDEVLVIASAGCNALDYLLAGPRSVHAVDANPRQIALLELKCAALGRLDFSDTFKLFGEGFHPQAREAYWSTLREPLSPFARGYWDAHIDWFRSVRGSFYFHGLAGLVAYAVRGYLKLRPALRGSIEALFEARDLDAQAQIYHREIAPRLWSPLLDRVLSSQLALNLLGVPQTQRRLIVEQHAGGVAGFVRDCVEYVATQLPLHRNYFWRVYFTGRYTRDCCPEYLIEGNARRLRDGLLDRLHLHTATVSEFLRDHDGSISRYVLLDHMDWMGAHTGDALREEWEWILARAAPGARVLLRSAHAQPPYLDALEIGQPRHALHERLRFRGAGLHLLQAQDRVHTYPGLVVADALA